MTHLPLSYGNATNVILACGGQTLKNLVSIAAGYVAFHTTEIQGALGAPPVRTLHDPLQDVHVHVRMDLGEADYSVYGSVAGAALVSLVFGIAPRANVSLLGELNIDGTISPVHQVGGPFIESLAGEGIDTIIVGVGVDTAEAKAAGERLNIQVVEVNSFLDALPLYFITDPAM